jgi:DNA-binding NarL/FixJ family response regulator
VVDLLRAGARGVFLKRDEPREVVNGVRAAAQGRAAFGSNVATMLVPALTTNTSTDAICRPNNFDTLSIREREVIELVASGKSNQEISQILFIEVATVKSHVSHALQKLGLRDRVQAVAEAYRLGVVHPGQNGRP